MSVSSVLFSPLRFFERTEEPALEPNQEKTYAAGTRFERSLEVDAPLSSTVTIFRLIETLNTEPLLAGNNFFLLNRPGVISDVGAPLCAKAAIQLLENNKAIVIQLARVRPAPQAHTKIVPMKDFAFHIASTNELKAWWQKVGRVFFDCVF